MSFARRWLSPREVSEYVGCHVMTVYGWIASGTISSTRLGRKILIEKSRLDEQLRTQAAPIGGRRGNRP
jgi:excisionase family DNA binding protein